MRRRRSSASRDVTDRGSVAVIVAAAFVPLTMAMAVVADGGRVWMEKQKLQNDVEASALAVAQSSALGGTTCGVCDGLAQRSCGRPTGGVPASPQLVCIHGPAT